MFACMCIACMPMCMSCSCVMLKDDENPAQPISLKTDSSLKSDSSSSSPSSEEKKQIPPQHSVSYICTCTYSLQALPYKTQCCFLLHQSVCILRPQGSPHAMCRFKANPLVINFQTCTIQCWHHWAAWNLWIIMCPYVCTDHMYFLESVAEVCFPDIKGIWWRRPVSSTVGVYMTYSVYHYVISPFYSML